MASQEPKARLIALLAGRAFTVKLEDEANRLLAFEWLTARSAGGTGFGNAPDAALKHSWLDTDEGFRIRMDAVDAYVLGHKQGEWAVAAE